jgi:glycosyltransferase involved in cell wall biosynthesis
VRPVRILLLGRDAGSLPAEPPWDPSSPRWRWTAAVGGAEEPRTGYAVHVLRAPRPRGVRREARSALTFARSAWLARRHGTAVRWVWVLKRSRDLRRLLRGSDVVWSLDRSTDAALAAVPDLLEGREVMTSGQWVDGRRGLATLDRLLAEVAAGPPDDDAAVRDEAAEEATLADWARTVSRLRVDALPALASVVDAVTAAARAARAGHRGLFAERVVRVLDSASWPPDERTTSGLAARRLAAELSLGTPVEEVGESALGRAAHGALAGADEALDRGDTALALARLADGAGLLLHRTRHAEVPWTPLVEDPAAFLGPLRTNRTLQALLHRTGAGPGPASAEEEGGPDRPPRVLVVAGAYGQFHQSVVDALRPEAEVKIRDFALRHPVLAGKVMDPVVLPALQRLVGLEDGTLEGDHDDAARAVRSMVRWADVVFADWADRATVWVSHLCPPEVRLVVRVHAIDALDPWLHLVRWERVERVVVVSEAMRSLVVDLLAGTGAGGKVPVTTMHVLTGLREMARPKSATARTTLGMLGWGRKVKDPMWALDLLERDPSWQLVLIGPGFPERPHPPVAAYVEQLRARMASASFRDRVHVVGPVTDVAEPMREVGVILSTSLREGWHLGLVEGAASGAVPVVRNWPMLASRGGPRVLYPSEWVVDDLDAAEARVRELTAPDRWEAARQEARARALLLFDPDRVAQDYRDVILRGRPPAPTPRR